MSSSRIVVGILFLLSACNPAGSKFEEADKLLADGNFDEAITTYEQVATAWPDSPEAQMVPDSIKRVLVGKTTSLANADDIIGALNAHAALVVVTGSEGSDKVDATLTEMANRKYSEDDYEAVGKVYHGLVEAHGTQTVSELFEQGLVDAVTFVASKDDTSPISFQLIRQVSQSEEASPVLKGAATTWICDRTDEIPGLSQCAAVPSASDEEQDLAGAKASLSDAEDQCSTAKEYKGICGDDLDARIDEALAGPVVQLRKDVAARQTAWERNSKTAAGALKRKASSLGRSCRSYQAQSNALQGRMLDAVVRNQFAAAMRLDNQNSNLTRKGNDAKDALDDLKKKVMDADWPEEVKREATLAITKERDSC